MEHATTGRRAALATLAAAPLLTRSRPARAAYPERPVRWVVAYAPGGGTDTLARLVGARLAQRLGQPFVVENRPGGATAIGAEAAARAVPDGHTLLSADNGTLVFNAALFRRLPYDPDRDFRPVGLLARFPLLLVAGPGLPDATLRDFAARARAAPGTIDYASPGIGSPHHLALERLAREAGIRLAHVPYRGMAPALNDLLAGTVPALMVDYPSAAEHLRAGRMRALAVFSAAPLDDLPATPAVHAALGLPGLVAHAWQGLVAPRATPDAVVAVLTAALAETLREAELRDRLRALGLEPLEGGPAAFDALLATERATWLSLIRDLGIVLD